MSVSYTSIISAFYFIVMEMLFLFSRKSFFEILYKNSGRTDQEINEVKSKMSGFSATAKNMQQTFKYWIVEKSPQKTKIKLSLKLHSIISVVIGLFTSLAIIGIVVLNVDAILKFGYFIVPVLNIASFIIPKIMFKEK